MRSSAHGAPSFGAPVPGSPAIQAAARGTGDGGVPGRSALRAGVRVLAVRVLAVAGFAGAAWLLGSATAHADRGLSPVDSLAGAAQPVVSLAGSISGPASWAPASSATGSPAPRTTDRPTGTGAPVIGAATEVGDLFDPVAAAVRTVAPVTGAVVQPVTRTVVHPVTRAVAPPVTRVIDMVTRAGTGQVTAGRDARRGAHAAGPTAADPTARGAGTTAIQVHGGSGERISTHQLGASSVGHMPWLDPAPAATESRSAPAGGFGTPFLPDRPLAPMQAHLGGGGTSAPGPGCHSDGGPNAVADTSSATGTADLRRLRAGSEGAQVRREPAAPTVSPD